MNTATTNPKDGANGKTKAERDADIKDKRRREQAGIVAGLQTVLSGDEQLLGFTRGRISGGLKGKLSVGPEAFFAPYVNIGLTDRRLIVQHIHHIDGRPSEIMPHLFPLGDLASLRFDDIETFGGEPAGRLIVRQTNEQSFRIRLSGQTNWDSVQALTEVFVSLTATPRAANTPTQHTCTCGQRTLDQPYKFCPFCGLNQIRDAQATAAQARTNAEMDVAAPTQSAADVGHYPIEVPIPMSNTNFLFDSSNPAPEATETTPSVEASGPQDFPEIPVGEQPSTGGPAFQPDEYPGAATPAAPSGGANDDPQDFPELPIGDGDNGTHTAPHAPDAPDTTRGGQPE